VHEVTRVLSAIEQGDPQAAEQLLPLVYAELRRLAAEKMAQETPRQTLQATALVHEAYLRLVDVERAQHWEDRGHFFAAAAEAMRRILIENARRKRGPTHCGTDQLQAFEEVEVASPVRGERLLALDEALTKLADQDPTLAKLVNLRYFGGLTLEQVAEILGVSPRTVDRYWAYAKAWLCEEIDGN
jgi:RNA polymerase sigma factor (TIGR02999 family)